jgi:hypothetical protein
MGKGNIRYVIDQPVKRTRTTKRAKQMTSLVEVADLVQEGNKSLKSLDDNFEKFFKIQERNRLDRYEDKLDAARAKRGVATGAGFFGGSIAKAATSGGGGGFGLNFKTAAKVLGLGVSAIGVPTAYRLLRNFIDDRVGTQRGLLRIEADELKYQLKEERKRLKERTNRRFSFRNEARVTMLRNVREAEARYRVDQDRRAFSEVQRFERAKYNAEMRKQENLRNAQKNIAIRAKDLSKAAYRSSKLKLRDVINEIYNEYPELAPEKPIIKSPSSVKVSGSDVIDSKALRNGASFIPRVGDSSGIDERAGRKFKTTFVPSAITSSQRSVRSAAGKEFGKAETDYDKLNKVSEADINRAGFKRIVNPYTGATSYWNMETKLISKHVDVLDSVKIVQNSKELSNPRFRTSVNSLSRYSGMVGKTFRTGIAITNPIEAAIQAGLEKGSYAKNARFAKAFGLGARVFGSATFGAILNIAIPTAMGDGTLTALYYPMYRKVVAAIVSGDYRKVKAIKAELGQSGVLPYLMSDAETAPLINFVLNSTESELKTFTQMQSTRVTGKQFRLNSEKFINKAPKGYGSANFLSMNPSERSSIRPILRGEEFNALDQIAFEAREFNARAGNPNVVIPGQNVTTTTVNNNNGIILDSGTPPAADQSGGGGTTSFSSMYSRGW